MFGASTGAPFVRNGPFGQEAKAFHPFNQKTALRRGYLASIGVFSQEQRLVG